MPTLRVGLLLLYLVVSGKVQCIYDGEPVLAQDYIDLNRESTTELVLLDVVFDDPN